MTVAASVAAARVDEHDLVVVDSDEQLRAAAVAFLDEGAAAGDLMHTTLPGRLVEELAPGRSAVTFTAVEQLAWRREPDTIGWIRRTAADCAPRRVRLMTLVTAPTGRLWD